MIEDPLVNNPWLSVLMPTYNGERYLVHALESVAVQECADIEVLLIDDGSTDRTLEIANSFATRIPIFVHSVQHSGNWVRNCNVLLNKSRGRYISFLHQDDCWCPGRLSHLRALCERFPNAGVLLHPSFFIDESSQKLGIWRSPFPKSSILLSPEQVFSKLLVQNFIAIPAPIVRREAMLSVGPLDEALWYTADWKLWLSLASKVEWVYCSTPLSCFRLHRESQTIKRAEMHEGQLQAVRQEFLFLEKDKAIRAMAKFSVFVNSALAGATAGVRPSCRELGKQLVKLGPSRTLRYLYYSRLHERLLPRIRLELSGRLRRKARR